MMPWAARTMPVDGEKERVSASVAIVKLMTDAMDGAPLVDGYSLRRLLPARRPR